MGRDAMASCLVLAGIDPDLKITGDEKVDMLTIVTETFSRTDSGKSWRTVPDETTTETLPWDRRDVGFDERYGESVHLKITSDDTLRWFRRLGGSEYAERSYTPHGYIVTRLVSSDPSRTVRKVRRFRFTEV